jgi:transcriptional regulator with XRE-family HTH domain
MANKMLNYSPQMIPSRIKQLLKERGMTREKLAVACEWKNASSISQYLMEYKKCKSRVPSLDVLCRIANALDCDIDFLLGVIDTPRKITADVCDATGLTNEASQQLIISNKYGYNVIPEFISALLESQDGLLLAFRYAKYKELINQHKETYDDKIVQKASDVVNDDMIGMSEYRFMAAWHDFLAECKTEG